MVLDVFTHSFIAFVFICSVASCKMYPDGASSVEQADKVLCLAWPGSMHKIK